MYDKILLPTGGFIDLLLSERNASCCKIRFQFLESCVFLSIIECYTKFGNPLIIAYNCTYETLRILCFINLSYTRCPTETQLFPCGCDDSRK